MLRTNKLPWTPSRLQCRRLWQRLWRVLLLVL
jgi:hypothetical protein